jgi:REP element-mobilizing transposase RayT
MRPKRLKTFNYLGCHHYSLTFCTFRRQQSFRDVAIVRLVEGEFLRTAIERHFVSLAYCFMPDHVHFLMAGTRDDAALIPCVEVMRQRSSRAVKRLAGFRLWQDGYFERVLRRNEDIPVAAQYIFDNPVREKLIERARDWPYSGGILRPS